MNQILTDELIKKYSWPAPYYGSYPTRGRWKKEFDKENFKKALDKLIKSNNPISLYLHFPFCRQQCLYCFCNSQITHNRVEIKNFLNDLTEEIKMFVKFFEKNSFKPNVREIQIGGGSPSYMNDEEFEFLMDYVKMICDPLKVDEFAFEIDPRTIEPDKIEYYKAAGVNRISFGIQDFNPEVQKAVNRIQPKELIQNFMTPKVKKGLKGINFDLLHGLPLQTIESFRETVETTLELSPDRITLLKYAHMPERTIHQKLLEKYPFPNYIDIVKIFSEAIKRFDEEGYVQIGVNDFVKPSDDLAIASKNKTLHRIFNGFTSGRTRDLIGIGPGSYGAFLNYYFQNFYFGDYHREISKGDFPILKGYELNRDDLIRREVINSLLCERAVEFKKIEEKFGISFKEYFKEEIEKLSSFIKDGLIEYGDNSIKMTALGKVFFPHLLSVFDSFLKNETYKMTGC